ncbi:hypothetical protein OPQ81_004808 [Rhizoctonia solani]|nr:hypothetical protein OPQ81_004808 [Rhizoctonia solani]
MSHTPALDYLSTTNTAHTDHETIIAAAIQPTVTSISTGKKGLGGSVIAGAIIGGVVVATLIVAIFFGLRHRYRRSKGQTASTMEAGPEGEKGDEKCAEVSEGSHGHTPPPIAACPSTHVQEHQGDVIVYQTAPIPSSSGPRSPEKSFDGSQGYPNQTNHSNIITHAPRPQPYHKGQSFICGLDPGAPPCMSCALSAPTTSRLTGGDLSAYSPKEEHHIYDRKSCVPSTSPPLPPGAMPPLPSPTLESYEEQFKALSPPQSPLPQSPSPRSPPPQSPSSPGGGCVRIVEMSFGGSRKGCFKCGNLGHIAEACPSETRLCYNCREPGHESINCPSPRSTQAKQCYMCGGVGHIQVDCPNNLRPSGGGPSAGQKCYNCGRPGHIARCFRCHGLNHFARDCMAPAGTTVHDNKAKTCYKCHKEGHIARECPDGAEFAT